MNKDSTWQYQLLAESCVSHHCLALKVPTGFSEISERLGTKLHIVFRTFKTWGGWYLVLTCTLPNLLSKVPKLILCDGPAFQVGNNTLHQEKKSWGVGVYWAKGTSKNYSSQALLWHACCAQGHILTHCKFEIRPSNLTASSNPLSSRKPCLSYLP